MWFANGFTTTPLFGLCLVTFLFAVARSESGAYLTEFYDLSAENDGSGSGELPESSNTTATVIHVPFLDDVDKEESESLVVNEVRRVESSVNPTKLQNNDISTVITVDYSEPRVEDSSHEHVSVGESPNSTHPQQKDPSGEAKPPAPVVAEIRVSNTSSPTISVAPLHNQSPLQALASVLLVGCIVSLLLAVLMLAGRRRRPKAKLQAENVEEREERKEEMVRSYVAERRESTENTFLLSEYLKTAREGSVKQ